MHISRGKWQKNSLEVNGWPEVSKGEKGILLGIRPDKIKKSNLFLDSDLTSHSHINNNDGLPTHQVGRPSFFHLRKYRRCWKTNVDSRVTDSRCKREGNKEPQYTLGHQISSTYCYSSIFWAISLISLCSRFAPATHDYWKGTDNSFHNELICDIKNANAAQRNYNHPQMKLMN